MVNNSSIEISTYSNPCGDRIDDAFPEGWDLGGFVLREQSARQDRDGYKTYLLDEYGNTWDNSGELLQRIYPGSLIKVPEIDKWHHDIVTWMPPDAQNWWFEQFKNQNNSHLDSMSREWWRLRARNLFVARDKDNGNRPVGAAALTIVYLSERDYVINPLPENTSPWCYEIRGLVVDESYRGQRIGRKLTQTALLHATLQQPAPLQSVEERRFIPTVAMTTNPVAAHILKELKATDKPSESNDFPYGGSYEGGDMYNDALCYSRFKPYIPGMRDGRLICSDVTLPPCQICPKTNKVAWWWPTHSKDLMDKLEIFKP